MKRAVYFFLVSLLVFTSCKKSGNPISPSDESASITYEGKVYHTIKIGTQTWLKENLDVGTMIQGTANPSNNGVIEKYCYGNDTANCSKYGGLYQWSEAMAYDTIEGTKGICPTGWHIPTKAEFDTLVTAVQYNGNSLKAVGQGTGDSVGTNTSGFSALFAGYRSVDGSLITLGSSTVFWSSTEDRGAYAYGFALWDYSSSTSYDRKEFGSSIRCIKD
ncbi:MAG: FISUMP domain-containing protein [Ignavibacteriaceae bacterium]|jgi:uncharacterized protein (TIGR02145 family)